MNSSTAESVTVGTPASVYTFNWRAGASGSGLWTNAANWDDNVVPGAGGVPVFSGTGATMTSVDLGAGNVTVAGLVFNKKPQQHQHLRHDEWRGAVDLGQRQQSGHRHGGRNAYDRAGVQLNSSVQITTTTSTDQLTISGAISDNGTGQSLTKAGAGKLLLTGALNYTARPI